MKKTLIIETIALAGFGLSMVGCVSPRQTATAGAWVGRQIAAPIGFTATALDETVQQSGDIVAANPRYDKDKENVDQD